MDVQFQPRQQDIFKSSTAKGDCGIIVAVSQLSSYQPAKPFLLVGHGSKPFSKNTRVHRLWDTPRQRTFLKILDIKPGQTSSDGNDPKELLSVDHPCHLKNRNAPKYIFMTTRY